MLKGIKCETAKCAIERREKSMAPVSMAGEEAKAVNMLCVCVKSRKSNDTTVCLRRSLCVISMKPNASPAIPARYC